MKPIFYMCVHAEARGQPWVSYLNCSPPFCFVLFLFSEAGSEICCRFSAPGNLELTEQTKLTDQPVSETCLSLLLQCWDYKYMPLCQAFKSSLGTDLCSSCLYTKHYTDQVFSSVLIFTFLLSNWCTHTGYSMADSKIGGGIISDEPGASCKDSKSEYSQEYLKTTQNNLQNKQSIKQTKTNLGICDTDTGTSIEYSWNNRQ